MMKVIWLTISLALCFLSPASAQTRSLAELANYRGLDREELLKNGAKKEG
jgi:hypothetical protein